MQPFMTAEEFHELDEVIADGWATLQEFYEPEPVTIRRRSETTGKFEDVATLTPIRIRMAPSVGTPVLAGPNTGGSEITHGGDMRVYTPADIVRDDRFNIGADTYVVGLVEPDDNHGTVIVNFTMLEGKRT